MLTKNSIYLNILLFLLPMNIASKTKKTEKRKEKVMIKFIEQLLKSLTDGEIVENEELNLILHNLKNCEDPIPVVKEFDKIIKCKKKIILNLAYK